MPASKIFLEFISDTKAEEKNIVENFFQRLQYTKPTLLNYEKPDFEATIGGKIIGIEVTKYYSDFTNKGSKSQRKISEWKKFAEKLKQKLSAKDANLSYIYGAIHFRLPQVKYQCLLEDKYTDELIVCVKSLNLKSGEQKTIEVSESQFPLLFKIIHTIYFHNLSPENKYLWWDASLQSGEVVENETALDFIINKKEDSAKNYKSDYWQKWLIIYAAGIGLGDIFWCTQNDLHRQGNIWLMKLENGKQQGVSFTGQSNYFTHIFIWDNFTENIFLLFPYFKKIWDCQEGKIWANHLPITNEKSQTD